MFKACRFLRPVVPALQPSFHICLKDDGTNFEEAHLTNQDLSQSLSVFNQDLLLAGRQPFAWPLMTGWPTTWTLRFGPEM